MDSNPFPQFSGNSAVWIAAVIVLMAGYVVGLLWTMGWITGWRALARRFPAGLRPVGKRFRFCSLRVWKIGGYNNCLTATLSEEGIYLAFPFPIPVGHPPLLFPWAIVGLLRADSTLGCRFHMVPLHDGAKTLQLILRGSAEKFVNEHANGPEAARPSEP